MVEGPQLHGFGHSWSTMKLYLFAYFLPQRFGALQERRYAFALGISYTRDVLKKQGNVVNLIVYIILLWTQSI